MGKEMRILKSKLQVNRYTSLYMHSKREADKIYYKYQIEKEEEYQKTL